MNNLVITNDQDSDIVQFDVLLPDNYDQFRIVYLNGCVINQNFLHVGDELKFRFSNNPLVYDNAKLKVKLIHTNYSTVDDPRNYQFVSLNLMKYYRIQFLPVYEFWDNINKETIYLFNPCNDKYILDEPINPPREALIFKSNAGPQSSIQATFTGNYVIAFKAVEKIPDISLKVGESIANSKQRPEDLGAYSFSGSQSNGLSVQQFQTTGYNYGADWTYPVKNLILQHRKTIRYTNTTDTYNAHLVFAMLDSDGKPVCQNIMLNDFSIVSGVSKSSIQGQEQTLTFLNYRSNSLSELTEDILTDVEYINPLALPIAIKSLGVYRNVYEADLTLPVKGDAMSSQDEGLFYINESNNNTITSLDPGTTTFINPNWYYSAQSVNIKAYYRADSSHPWAPLYTEDSSNKFYVIGDRGSTESKDAPVKIHFKDYDANIPLRGQWRDNGDDPVGDPVEVKFEIFMDDKEGYVPQDNSEENIEANPPTFTPFALVYIVGQLYTHEDGSAIIYNLINSGLTPQAKDYPKVMEYLTQEPIQLTESRFRTNGNEGLNDEDLYVSAITDDKSRDGLSFSMKDLNNNIHIVLPRTQTVAVKELKWRNGLNPYVDDAHDVAVKVFIPHKSTRIPTHFYYKRNYEKGFFVLTDVDGRNTIELLDNKTDFFLATGHSSLNVMAPAEDDLKYKTFNGSLIFDRSNAQITRLFSNDTTGSCLNYINDLLAAKLSRYFYTVDFKAFDSFFATTQKLILNANHRTIYGYYTNPNYQFYTGEHAIVMSSCQDIVKLLGSENVVNNCFSILSPEEQIVKTNPLTYAQVIAHESDIDKDIVDFPFKFFHFYNSGTADFPYLGFGANDSPNTTVGGVNTRRVRMDNCLTLGGTGTNPDAYKSLLNTDKAFYLMDDSVGGSDEKAKVKTAMKSSPAYPTNRYLSDCGLVETLPAFRLYRNANFEQADLTITTGGVKTLHPIYLQSTPRIFLNNLLYFFDFLLNALRRDDGTGFNAENIFNYIHVMTFDNSSITLGNTSKPILRYGKTWRRLAFTGGNIWLAESFDSAFVMNYLNNETINEFATTDELRTSLPSKTNQDTTNEEVIYSMESNSIYTNVQMFGKRVFNFFKEADYFGMVQFKMAYVETIQANDSILELYMTNNLQIGDTTQFINNIASYNNLKTGKLFIPKLGEFTQYAHVLYLTSESFNDAITVSIDNLNMSKYKSPFTQTKRRDWVDDETQNQCFVYDTKFEPVPDQKINVYLFGVMFRYHQLSLGWANLSNELAETNFEIKRDRGNRHFILTLYDDFGRTIPNTDTSQGFKNNLTLELFLS